MGVASWSWLSGLFVGLGRLGAAPAEAVAGCPARLCGVAGCRVLFGIGNTPVAAWFGWWWVPLACFVCVGGGMLSGFWGSAPWLPGLWFCFAVVWWGGVVGVGGLVVNCIVDASIITVLFL